MKDAKFKIQCAFFKNTVLERNRNNIETNIKFATKFLIITLKDFYNKD